MRTLDQESVSRREYLAIRPDRTERLDDRHQVIQGFEWISACSRRHVIYTAIGGNRLPVLCRYAHFRISSSNASRLKSWEYSYLVHLLVHPERLRGPTAPLTSVALPAAPRAAMPNLAEDGQVVKLGLLSVGSSS